MRGREFFGKKKFSEYDLRKVTHKKAEIFLLFQNDREISLERGVGSRYALWKGDVIQGWISVFEDRVGVDTDRRLLFTCQKELIADRVSERNQ